MMARDTLPTDQSDAGDSLFFPSFQKEMNRLIDQFRVNFPRSDRDTEVAFGDSMFPAVDVVETDDAVEISAEVPGVDEADLDVSISGEMLTLKGEKSSSHEESKDKHHLIERHYGSFRRHIPLGFAPEDDAVDASFSDGVLTLRIAKPANAKADVRKIDIRKS